MESKFIVTGMTCSACSSHVEKAVKKVEGISSVSVNLLTGVMFVVFDEFVTDADKIIDAVKKAGYGAVLDCHEKPSAGLDGVKREKADAHAQEAKQMRIRLIVSLVLMVILMYVSMGHMIGLPLPSFLTGTANAVSYALVQLLLCVPIIYVNRSYFINGFKRLFKLSPNMDSLIAVGSGASLIYGFFVIFRMSYALGAGYIETVEAYMHNLYFEAAGMILALVTVGKYLEAISERRTGEALDKLKNLVPKNAIVVRDGKEVEVDGSELVVGDVVVIKAGEAVPADAVVIEGSAFFDESAISGESVPVEKLEGENLIGGTINKNGYVLAKVTAVGGDGMLSKIIELVENAGASKAPIASVADKVSGIFVPVVIGISLVVLIGWLIGGYSFEHAFTCAISVLVISCPCALGLATPVAVVVGAGKGAENGILFKSGEALENLHGIKCIALDKTGTITAGIPVVDEIILDERKEETLAIVASIEKRSEHPLGEAVVAYAEEKGLELVYVEDFVSMPGKGVCAKVDGVKYAVGNASLMKAEGVEETCFTADLARVSEEGKTPLLISRNGEYMGLIATIDQVEPTSIQAVKELKKLGIKVVMLTGDNERTAHAIAKQAGIDEVYAGILPQDKERIVGEFATQGKVAMVGDGINDAPALACADVGIAIGKGSDIAVDSADVVLVKSDLLDVVTAVRLSRQTLRNIKENLFWALIYNMLCIPLAAGVLYVPFGISLTPMIGAAAMSISSIFVVLNALRLKLFKPTKQGLVGCSDTCVLQAVTDEKGTNSIKEKRSENMENCVVLKIEGMMCSHCTGRVEKVLCGVSGVEEVIASLEEKNAIVKGNNPLDLEVLKATVEEQGYTVISIDKK